MLAQAVMLVMIVLTEPITLGIWEHITAELLPKRKHGRNLKVPQ
jgi:hypothetical protein